MGLLQPHSAVKLSLPKCQLWIHRDPGGPYGFWLSAGPAVAMMEELLPSVISVVPAPPGSTPWDNNCLLARASLLWMMVLPSSTTEGTLPRVSTAPRAWPRAAALLVKLTFSPMCPRGPSPFTVASVEVRMTVLEAVCRTFECTRLAGGLGVLAKVTAPVAEEEEEEGWMLGSLRGTEVASANTDLVSADSLASDMTYSVFMGLVVVTVEKGTAWSVPTGTWRHMAATPVAHHSYSH